MTLALALLLVLSPAEAASKAMAAISEHQRVFHAVPVGSASCAEGYLEDADIKLHEYASGKNDAAQPITFSWHDAERYARAFADFGDDCVAQQHLNDGFFDNRAAILDSDAMMIARRLGDAVVKATYKRRAIAMLKLAVRPDSGVGEIDKDNMRREIAALEKL